MKRAHLHATLVLLGVVCVWLAAVSTVSAGKLDKSLEAPPIASIAPTSIQAGSGSFQLAITTTGAYDPATIQVLWNSTPLGIVATGTNTLTVTVLNTLITTAQVATISITDSTGPTTTPQLFTVTSPPNPPPSIANTAPSSAQAGTLTSIVINGSGFNASTTAQLGANVLPAYSPNSSTLVVTVTASLYTMAGNYPLTVTNPTPGGGAAVANITITAGPASQLTVSPASSTQLAGTGLALTAFVSDTYNNAITSGSVTWLSSAGNVIANGTSARTTIFTGTTAGPVAITATLGSANGYANVTVNANPSLPGSITITPNPAIVTASQAVVLNAAVRDIHNNVIAGAAVNWVASASVGTVNPPSGASTTLNATTVVNTYNNSVTATLGAATSTASVIVNPGPAQSLQIAQSSASITAGATGYFTATVRDAFSNPIADATNVVWTVTSGSGTMVTTSGRTATFTNNATGSRTIRAVYGATTVSNMTTLTVNPGPAANVLISPTVASMQVFSTRTFTATAVDAFNNPVAATLTWSALAGSVTPTTGNSTTYRAGTTAGVFNDVLRVTNGTFTGTADLTFTPGPVTQLALAPPSASLVVSTTQNFVATARDQYNNVVPTGVVTWSVSPAAAGAFVSTSALNATFRAGILANVFPGAVRATTNGVTTTATITVTPGAPAQVTLNPNNITLTPLGTQSFSAQLRDAYSNPISGASYTWSTVGTGSVTPTSPGAPTATFQAGAVAGTYPGAVRATANGFTGQANVVINPSAPASIVVSPGSATLGPLGTQAFTARAFDTFGNEITPIAVNWTVNSPTAGSIASIGLAAATFEAGTLAGSYPAAVRASTSGVTGTANITINPGPLNRIDVAPALATLVVNQTQGFVATGYDAYDNLAPSSFTWSVAPPIAGTFDSSSAVSAIFRAGNAPNTYPAAVRAQSGAIVGAADIVIQTGTATAVQLSPASTTAPIGSLQLFTANVVDQFGNPVIGPGVLWQTTVGAIESSGAYTALVRIGTTAGSFGSGVKAFFGPIEGIAAVAVPADPASDLHISANPGAITTDGVSASTISVQVTDGYGNPVGAGLPVSLAIDQCPGTCALATSIANTDPSGRIATTLRSDHRSASAAITSVIKVSANMSGANGVVSKSVDVNGSFTPFKAIAPAVIRDYPPNNHTSCTALRITPPQTVKQPSNVTFNIYRFTATRPTYTVIINGFASAGQLEVYRVLADSCAANNSMSVAVARAPLPITPAQFQTTLTNVFAPGTSYLLVVKTTAAPSNTPYAITVQP